MTGDLVPVGAGVSRAPTLDTYGKVQKFANVICGTEFVPSAMRHKPEVVFAAIAWGLEAGLGPLQAVRGVQVIEGQVGPKPELARALVMQRGHTFGLREWTNERCEVYGKRADSGEELTVVYTLDDAVTAGLVQLRDGKPYARSSKGLALPWERHTKRMLLARATGDLCAALFPDVVAGLSYMSDELSEIAGRDFDVDDAEVPGGDDLVVDAVIVEDRVAADAGSVPLEPPTVGGDDDAPGPNPASDPGATIADAEVVEPDADGVPAIGAEDEAAPPFGVRDTVDPKALADQAMRALGAQHKVELRRWLVANHVPTLAKNMTELQATAVLARIGEGFS